eukprot:2510195-Prymnesium_polylepis.2
MCHVWEALGSLLLCRGVGRTRAVRVLGDGVLGTVGSPHPEGSVSDPLGTLFYIHFDKTAGGTRRHGQAQARTVHFNTVSPTRDSGGHATAVHQHGPARTGTREPHKPHKTDKGLGIKVSAHQRH